MTTTRPEHTDLYVVESDAHKGPSKERRGLTNRKRPAQAGMNPTRTQRRSPETGVGRAGGDGPLHQARLTDPVELAPRRRGWTVACLRGADTGSACPALAGMSRGEQASVARPDRTPRTRGDRQARRLRAKSLGNRMVTRKERPGRNGCERNRAVHRSDRDDHSGRGLGVELRRTRTQPEVRPLERASSRGLSDG